MRRSVRLIEHGVERFAKRIRPRPTAAGTLALAADPGDRLARARRLVTDWYGRDDGTYAVLARTNRELAPFAALAIELGIPYHAAEDGLRLDDPAPLRGALDRLPRQAGMGCRTSGGWVGAMEAERTAPA